jgi:hypothetical protein
MTKMGVPVCFGGIVVCTRRIASLPPINNNIHN